MHRLTKRKVENMKKLIGTLLSAMMLSASVYAADITTTRDIDNSKFAFICNTEAGACVTVNVYAPGKDFGNLFDPSSTDEQTDIVKYHNEFYADKEGRLEFKVGINGDSGIYKTYITVGEDTKEIPLEYVKKANNEPLITALNDPNTDILTLISTGTNRADLGFFLDLYDNVDENKVIQLIKEQLPVSTPVDAIDAFNEASIITALSEGDISGISVYAEKLAVLGDGGRFEKRYSLQAEGVDDRLCGRVYNSVGEFESALAEAVVLETIKNPNGYQNIHDVLDEFKSETGLTSLTDLSVVYQQMVGKNYKNYAEMKAAYNAFLADALRPGVGGPGGGSGSGGGSGIGVVATGKDKPTPIEKTYFKDMKNAAWAKEAVNYLAEEGIISGKSDDEFCPSDEILREEFVKMTVNAFGFKKIADLNEFSDVDESAWYYEYVMAAKQNGFVNGVNDSEFGIGGKITRQDMATILYRVSSLKKIELKQINDKKTFNDDAEISDYAKKAIEALQTSGIINGMDDGFFMPKSTATRAQAAQMIYGLLTVK